MTFLEKNNRKITVFPRNAARFEPAVEVFRPDGRQASVRRAGLRVLHRIAGGIPPCSCQRLSRVGERIRWRFDSFIICYHHVYM
jgi:hypothetical protein